MNFKIKFATLIISIFTSIPSFSQESDALLGLWQSEHGNVRIQLYKSGNSYDGKLVWLKEDIDESGNPKTDIHNPSEALKSQPVKGLEVLSGFSYKNSGVWEGGTVYDPRSGNKYSCKLSMSRSDRLEIRAFKGISLIGKTHVWSRVR
jgi:uncharacterized protein (DUF2147 family)